MVRTRDTARELWRELEVDALLRRLLLRAAVGVMVRVVVGAGRGPSSSSVEDMVVRDKAELLDHAQIILSRMPARRPISTWRLASFHSPVAPNYYHDFALLL